MSKVLIINSPLFRYTNPLYDEDSLPPIGLGHIATILKERILDVELIDAVAENIPLEDLLKIITAKHPFIVATNIFTTNYELVKDLIESIKNRPINFIIGGISTKDLYKDICKWSVDTKIDIVFGDGEYITYDLIMNKVKETPIFQTNNRRVFKIDKNSQYFVKNLAKVPLNRFFFKNEPIKNCFGFNEAHIVTSRNCIYNCAFCSAARSSNRDFPIREKSKNNIIKEIRYIKSIYPEVESIRVLDDLFLKTKHTLEKAIEIFSNFKFYWRSMAHVKTFEGISLDTLYKLRDSGCIELFIGVESGSPQILTRIHKTSSIDIIKENLVNIMRAGINIKGYFIYGFPDETEDDFKRTYDLAYYLKEQSLKYGSNFRTSVFQFRPYHGTELYHDIELKLLKEGVSTISSIEPNPKLSKLIGRSQFNFYGGNYSKADIETVHKYIYFTTNLNT